MVEGLHSVYHKWSPIGSREGAGALILRSGWLAGYHTQKDHRSLCGLNSLHNLFKFYNEVYIL